MIEKYAIFLHVSAILVICLPYLKTLLMDSFIADYLGSKVLSLIISLLFWFLLSVQFYLSYVVFKAFWVENGAFILSFYKNVWDKFISFFKCW